MDQIKSTESKTQFTEVKLKKNKKSLVRLISPIITDSTFKGIVIV